MAGEVEGEARDIRKPNLPPLAFVAFGMWPLAALSILGLQTVDGYACAAAAALSCCFVVGLACAVWKTRGSRIILVALGCALGCSLGCWYAAHLHALQDEVAQAASKTYRFRIVEDPHAGDFGDSCIAEVALESGCIARVRVNLPDEGEFACWDTFESRCRLKPCSEAAQAYYWQKGCAGTATIHSYESIRASGAVAVIGAVRRSGLELFEGVGGDGAALLRALVFGNRESLFASDFYGDVKATGLAHIVAVSGSHLAVMAAFVALVLQRTRCPRRLSVFAQALFIVAYVVFAGAPHSAIRSAVMAFCGMAAYFVRRRASPLNALAVCVVGMLAIDPSLALSLSFQLSSCAVLGIILFASYLGAWFDAMLCGHAKGVSQIFGMTCAANAFTLPISIATFGQLSLISPIANVLIVPVFAFLCVGGMLVSAVSFLLIGAAPQLIAMASFVAQAVCDAITLCAHLPYACIPATGRLFVMAAIAAGTAALLLHTWPAPSRRVGYLVLVGGIAAVAALLVAFPGLHRDEIVMLDVGQGDAFVVRSGARAVLIDTGTNDAMVLAGLARHDVRNLDAIIITHPDDDHCGSLPAVLDVVGVERICVAADLLESSGESCAKLRSQIQNRTVVPLEVGDGLVFGDYACTVLWPRAYADEGGNADSLVVTLDADCNRDGAADWHVLFCGDAEKDVLGQLARDGSLRDVDVLKVGHHGSKNAVDGPLLDVLRPEASLVSVGANNRYGHPTGSTLQSLQDSGSQVFRTDASGDVVCKLSADVIRVSTVR